MVRSIIKFETHLFVRGTSLRRLAAQILLHKQRPPAQTSVYARKHCSDYFGGIVRPVYSPATSGGIAKRRGLSFRKLTRIVLGDVEAVPI